MAMNIFIHNGEPYMQITPAKRLMQSTLVYEVIIRKDIFAVNLNTRVFTIIKREVYEAAVARQRHHE